MTVILELYDSGGRMYSGKTKKKKFVSRYAAERYIKQLERKNDEDLSEGEDYNIEEDDNMGGVF